MNTLQLFKYTFFSFRITACEKMAFWKVILYAVFKCYFSTTYYQTSLFCATRGATRFKKLQKSCLTFLLKMARCKQIPKNLALFIKPTRLFLRLIQMENVQPLMSKRI